MKEFYKKTKPLARLNGQSVKDDCEGKFICLPSAFAELRSRVASDIAAGIGTRGLNNGCSSDHQAIDVKEFVQRWDAQNFPLDSGM